MSADACSAEELDDPAYPGTLAESHALIAQLTEALGTREVIAQAKGIIMVKESCDSDEAFRVLRRISQHTHRKLRDVAAEIVASVRPGQEPGAQHDALTPNGTGGSEEVTYVAE